MLRTMAGGKRHPDARFLLAPSSAYWALPALFLGIITSAIPTTFLFKALLGTPYGRFEEFTNFQAGDEETEIMRFVAERSGVPITGGLTGKPKE